jgi:hypothetical protein
MKSDKRSQHRNTASKISDARMSTLDNARAYEGMKQAMALGNLTLEACGRIRSLLRSMAQVARRGIVPKRSFTKGGATFFD